MRRPVQATIVLVIVLLVGGLFGVLVRNARLTANRTGCINNLKQIGIAIHNYHDTYKRFPQGTVPNDLPPDQRLSWLTEIWPPFMVGGIMTRFDKTKPWNAPENDPPHILVRDYPEGGGKPVFQERVFEVTAFFCPANPDRGGPASAGYTHYVGIAGVGEDAAELPLSDPRAGFFGYDRKLSTSDITRDSANTLMAAEVTNGGPWTAGGRATSGGLSAGSPYVGDNGQFTSRHEPANFLFADASVRPLSASVTPVVLEAMARIAVGDPP